MSINITPNREKVLLNLKWFTHRVTKAFELKLIYIISTANYNSFKVNIFKSNTARSITDPSCTDVPLIRKLLQQQVSNNQSSFSSETDKRNFSESFSKLSTPRLNHLRIRSLTNSPLSNRIKNCTSLSSNKNPNVPSNLSPAMTDSPEFYNGSNASLESNISGNSLFQMDSSRKFRLVVLHESTTEAERKDALTKFAEQLCVIYEYQLGMLRGLKAVHLAADYVAEVVLRSFKAGIIQTLSPYDLNASLLFEPQCRPQSASKLIKTCPMTVTGEQLNWRVGDIWILPGLRHNEVGGENCHNLSIVTHFLSPSVQETITKRPDIYGYRNIIVLPTGGIEGDEVISQNGDDGSSTDENSGQNSKTCPYFDMLPYDNETITRSEIRAGTKNDPLKSSNNRKNSKTDSEKTTANGSSSEQIRNSSINSATSLRQYLHRAYRPVFFVIFDRPAVLEHLTECESFASFCKRQSISPVMYVNQPTVVFNDKSHYSLYQNFTLFNVYVNGHKVSPDNGKIDKTKQTCSPPALGKAGCKPDRSVKESPKLSLSPSKNLSKKGKSTSAYDNPGFVC